MANTAAINSNLGIDIVLMGAKHDLPKTKLQETLPNLSTILA